MDQLPTASGRRNAVLIPLFEGAQNLGVSAAADVLSAANEVASGEARFRYEVLTASLGGGPIRISGGLTVLPDADLADMADIDTLVIPSADGVPVIDSGTADALGALARRARRVAAVCTGAFVLAEAGLLDGRRAATHWEFADELARRFPAVVVDARDTVVRDGPLTTSGGVASALDLALALVEDDLGQDVAQRVARSFVTYQRKPGGQAQFAEPRGRDAHSPAVREVQRQILANPRGDLSIRSLSHRAGLSERHFTRLFRAEVGLSAREYVERARVAAASRLLTETPRSPEMIAREAGFGTEATMRKAFLRLLQVSPHEYRNRFS
ncbi:helix-turn-helix domain-containing protein [Streptomyces sp. HC44]|uniref:Helix-turn-helix domain-containing protein n=1 Tax=Streptomyces scabichelini TaxID=2711217 RepID=A0A6G4VFU2_9ACTN|nr:DJ-1/PfpI family protein [Streptomyces scabichelini]NGO12667.1 helix-turn-helix domain-containing protein [Streptomyces scabichelini]